MRLKLPPAAGSSTADDAADMTDASDSADMSDALDGTDGVDTTDGADSEMLPPEELIALASCYYVNGFSQADECKEYTGANWTIESATDDCKVVFPGTAGEFREGVSCQFEAELGRCEIGDPSDSGYLLVSEGGNPDDCALAQTGCETFGGGAFTPDPRCTEAADASDAADSTDGADGDESTDGTDGLDGVSGGYPGVFVAGFTECKEPIEGDPAGAGPDGSVCTQNMIGGGTEPGYKFADYANCDVVYTPRPYYPYPAPPAGGDADPRLEDDAYMGELAWVTEQIDACGCVCCHSKEIAPDGPSAWYTDAGPLWVDTVTDTGVAPFTGLADTSSLGAYPPEENTGCDRCTTRSPTTDIPRMQAFWIAEHGGVTTNGQKQYHPYLLANRSTMSQRPARLSW